MEDSALQSGSDVSRGEKRGRSCIRFGVSDPGMAEELESSAAGALFPCTVGLDSRMSKKNRSKNVVPYDQNRVILPTPDGNFTTDGEDDDYINASFIRGYTCGDGYIVTQGPMLGTLEDFWTMVWAQSCPLLVMMSRLVENSQSQSYKYWPDVGDHLEVNELSVTTQMEDEGPGFVSRTMTLTHRTQDEERHLTQLQFLAWPQGMAMPCLSTFITFWKTFRRHSINTPDKTPILHSSDGSSRTGLLIAIDILYNQWNGATSPSPSLDITGCFIRMRDDRLKMVSRKEEQSYTHQAVCLACSCGRLWHQYPNGGRRCGWPHRNGLGNEEMTTINIAEEYQILTQSIPECLEADSDNILKVSGDDKMSDAEAIKDVPLPEHCFLAGTGSLTVRCVPLHHCTIQRVSTGNVFGLKRSVSLQEHTEQMGLGGVLPPHCRRSFLTMPIPDRSQTSDFWQMVFDTGCRTIVKFVPDLSEMSHENDDSHSFMTSELTVKPQSSILLNGEVLETTLTLSSTIVPIPTVDCEHPMDQPIKMLTLCWSRAIDSDPSLGTVLMVFDLIGQWLDQTRTTLVVVQCSDGQSESTPFCAAFNVQLPDTSSTDVLFAAREVQETLGTLLSKNEYHKLHQINEKFSLRQQSRLDS